MTLLYGIVECLESSRHNNKKASGLNKSVGYIVIDFTKYAILFYSVFMYKLTDMPKLSVVMLAYA